MAIFWHVLNACHFLVCIQIHCLSNIICTGFNISWTVVLFSIFALLFYKFSLTVFYLLTHWTSYFKCFFVSFIYRVMERKMWQFLSFSVNFSRQICNWCVLFLWETVDSTLPSCSTSSSWNWLSTISSSTDKLTNGTSIETFWKMFAFWPKTIL